MEFDFSVMDYDTYSIIIGGTYDEYLNFINSFKKEKTDISCSQPINTSLENNDTILLKNEKQEDNNKKGTDKETEEKAYQIMLLIWLEMLAYRYGFEGFNEPFNEDDIKRQLNCLFTFFEGIGYDKKQVMVLLRKFLSGKNKRIVR